ncbi:MAG: patatin-like phospholipase family protein [Candidatus Omnitrophota bacterium]|nr:MAG: patatin-like phospholipase family protein [Candidatus Omnitrophota bacterium]
MAMFKKRKIALALGGGAARGIANIGALKVLERERIPIDLIIGSSIGGLIGASYALGVPTYRMEEAALKFSVDELTDFAISKNSLVKGEKLKKIIEEFTDKKGFKDARIPFAITTTDIETGEELVYTKGPLQKIIQASCSWPGIFPPVIIEGRKLGDGGIRNSIPVKMAKPLGATHVIAVEIGFCVKSGKIDNLFQMFMQSIQILGEELDSYQSMQADVIIKPKLHNLDQFAFDRAKEAVQDGEQAAKKAIPEIKRKLKLNFNLWK